MVHTPTHTPFLQHLQQFSASFLQLKPKSSFSNINQAKKRMIVGDVRH